ncbi:Mbov_0396 family ICE element transmembrane protein [Mycoplasmopsis pullorum]|uniref:Uncharacterized protein n=1 Tax=Mycoplasmopsis pullorum TaxID=48003 RepID=A0A1L4FSW7_9BACT|nr:hypothetical protein [Mycoplasmopsis pullorum]APJ38684.1 hypothetical protein BLA55_03420 [Mycoplasmopsis pullorum]
MVLFGKLNPEWSDISFNNTTFIYSLLALVCFVVLMVIIFFVLKKYANSENGYGNLIRSLKKIPIIALIFVLTPFTVYTLNLAANGIFWLISSITKAENGSIAREEIFNSSLMKIVWHKAGLWDEWTNDEKTWWNSKIEYTINGKNNDLFLKIEKDYFDNWKDGSGVVLIVKATLFALGTITFLVVCLNTIIQVIQQIWWKTISLPIIIPSIMREDDIHFKNWIKNYFGHFAYFVGVSFVYSFFAVTINFAFQFNDEILVKSASFVKPFAWFTELLLFLFFAYSYMTSSFKFLDKIIMHFGLELDPPTQSPSFAFMKKMNPIRAVKGGIKKFKNRKPQIKSKETEVDAKAKSTLKNENKRTISDGRTQKINATKTDTQKLTNSTALKNRKSKAQELSQTQINPAVVSDSTQVATTPTKVVKPKTTRKAKASEVDSNELINKAQATNSSKLSKTASIKDETKLIDKNTNTQTDELSMKQKEKIEYFDKSKNDKPDKNKAQNTKNAKNQTGEIQGTTKSDIVLLIEKLEEINKNIANLKNPDEDKSKKGTKGQKVTVKVQADTSDKSDKATKTKKSDTKAKATSESDASKVDKAEAKVKAKASTKKVVDSSSIPKAQNEAQNEAQSKTQKKVKATKKK